MNAQGWHCPSMVQRDVSSPATCCQRKEEHTSADEHRYTYTVYLLNTRTGADPGKRVSATLTWRES